MKGYTKTGLLFLMISIIISLCASLVSYSLLSNFTPSDVQGANVTFLFSLLPVAIIGGLAGLLSIIGALFILLGRKEFGEKHQRYMKYAIIIFGICVITIIIYTMAVAFSMYSSIALGVPPSSSSFSTEMFQTIMTSALIYALVVAVLSGLIWVFALYNLENNRGRTILMVAYAAMILTAVVTVVATITVTNNWINQGTLDSLYSDTTSSSAYSQLISNSQWKGPTGVLLLVCQLIQNILLFFALYIPYKRIDSGELQPILPAAQTQKRCPTCGRQIPDDAINCPYCGTQL